MHHLFSNLPVTLRGKLPIAGGLESNTESPPRAHAARRMHAPARQRGILNSHTLSSGAWPHTLLGPPSNHHE